jgi:hypothetical protein
MRSLSWSLLLSTLAACSGDDETPTVDTHTATTTEESGTTLLDSSWPVGDLGNLHLAHHVNSGRTEVMGLFIDSSAGYLNMAQCTLFDTIPCIGGLPGEEDFEDVDRDQEVDPDVVDTRFLGFEIEFGPYVLPYTENARTGMGYYALDATALGFQTGKMGAKWGGQWEPRRSRDDLVVSEPIELLSPRPGGNIFAVSGTRLPIEWVPTGQGEVTLTVADRFTTYRFFHLKDDGYFELDVDTLGLTGNLEDLTLTLTRWDIAEVQWTGHYVRMVSSSDVFFTMDLANVGARDPLYVVDSCTEASGMPPLVSGDYWGRLDGFGNDLDPSSLGFPNCLSETYNWYATARGRDGLVRVELPPKSILNLEYTHFSESASVYLVTNCSQSASCEAGIDADISPGAPEVLSAFNATDQLERYYLVVDSSDDLDNAAEVFTLDVTIEALLDPEMFDYCIDSENATPTLTTAGYYEEFVAYTGDLNPGLGGCTASSLPGPEAMMPFTLNPGQTITAVLDMPEADGALYVLEGCDAFSCVAGSDLQHGPTFGPEQIVLTNTGAVAADLHLVVDSHEDGLRPFVLGVSFQ